MVVKSGFDVSKVHAYSWTRRMWAAESRRNYWCETLSTTTLQLIRLSRAFSVKWPDINERHEKIILQYDNGQKLLGNTEMGSFTPSTLVAGPFYIQLRYLVAILKVISLCLSLRSARSHCQKIERVEYKREDCEANFFIPWTGCVWPSVVLMEHNSSLIDQSWPLLGDGFLQTIRLLALWFRVKSFAFADGNSVHDIFLR